MVAAAEALFAPASRQRIVTRSAQGLNFSSAGATRESRGVAGRDAAETAPRLERIKELP